MILQDTYYYILNMSMLGSGILLILLLLRWLVRRRIPKRYIYPLWSIAFIRLMVPISITNRWSVLNLFQSTRVKSINIIGVGYERDVRLAFTNSIQTATEYFPIEHKSTLAENFFQIGGYVWFIGACLCLLSVLTMYILTMKRLKKGIRHKAYEATCSQYMEELGMKGSVGVIQVSGMETPIVVGVTRPRIIIPEGIGHEKMGHILRHELSHIRRHDPLWKLLAIITVCFHWFNPLIWLSFYSFDRDMEMACDEKVLGHLPKVCKKDYAKALTELAGKQSISFAAFGNRAIKDRIINISRYKRLPLIMGIAIMILGILLSIILLTNRL